MITLWEMRKILPGINEGEFTELEIENHNSRFVKFVKIPKIDDSQWTKKRIREELKILRHQCYELLNESNNDTFAQYCNESKLAALNRRIRELQYRLSGVSKRSNTEIGPGEIARAKESPIQDYFTGGKLRRNGATLTGRCPFHDERTGSFTIYTAKNRWQCFGACATGGDIIDFVMKTQNLTFIPAIKWLLNLK